MLAPLFQNVGGTWTIYSVGDGLFMKRVLDGVAAMSNSGLFLSLGALGMMLGLGIIAFQHLVSNGQKLEIGSLLISFVLFCVFFGAKTDVLIQDLGGAPGSVQNGVYAVDNVPFGLAVAGSLVSTVGLTLSEKMSQGYGLPGGSTDANGVSGFGRSLEWINAVRNWELPEFAGSGNNDIVSRFKRNVTDYIASCTLVGADNGQIDLPRAFQAADPFQIGSLTGGGIGYNNMFLTTKWVNPDGSIGGKDCASAINDLAADAHGNALFTSFANAAAPRMKRVAPGVPADTQMMDAFSDIGIAGDKAADYMAASAVNAVWTMALRKGSDPSGLDVMTQVMMNQSIEQRATQWGADESMFRQVMRPTAAFFESMIYAMAPFMALMIGLGPWGIRKMGQYMILTIWVALWQPVLAVVNLFQMTMVEHAVVAMSQVPPGATPLSLTSLAGAANLQHQIVNWIATGSTIAAATPAITMMLIFGGAVAATSLSGRLQGAEFTNEKLAAPDIAKDAPVMERKSAMSHDVMSGTMATGSGQIQPMYQTSSAAKSVTKSAESAMASSNLAFTAGQGSTVANAVTNSSGMDFSAGSTFNKSATQSQQALAKWGRDHNYDASSTNAATWAAISAASVSGQASLAADLAKGAGIGVGGSGSSQRQFSEKDAQALGESLRMRASSDSAFSATLAQATQDTVQKMASLGSKEAQSATQSDEWKRSQSDMQEKRASFEQARSDEASLGAGQSIGNQTAAHNIVASGGGDWLRGMALAHAGAPALQQAQHQVDSAPWKLGSAEERQAQAALIALRGDINDPSVLRAGHEGDRQRAFLGALTAGGMAVGAGVQGVVNSDAHQNGGLGAAVQSGAATQGVQHAGVGSGLNADSVRAQGHAMVAGQLNGEADAASRAGIQPMISQSADTRAKLGEHMEDPTGSRLADDVSQHYQDASAPVGAAGGAARQVASDRQVDNGAGSTAQKLTDGWRAVNNFADNQSPTSTDAALRVAAAIGRGESKEALWDKYGSGLANRTLFSRIATLGTSEGVSGESAFHTPQVPEKARASTEAYNQALPYYESHYPHASPALVSAMAAVSATWSHGGASAEVGKAYEDARAQLAPYEARTLDGFMEHGRLTPFSGGIGDMAPGSALGFTSPQGMEAAQQARSEASPLLAPLPVPPLQAVEPASTGGVVGGIPSQPPAFDPAEVPSARPTASAAVGGASDSQPFGFDSAEVPSAPAAGGAAGVSQPTVAAAGESGGQPFAFDPAEVPKPRP